MDETEITNNEYRQYVHWVRDSIIRKELAQAGIEDFIKKNEMEEEQYDRNDEVAINWEAPIDLKNDEDGTIQEIIDEAVFYADDDRLTYVQKELDVTKLIYNYYWVDLRQAAKPGNRFSLDENGQASYDGTVIQPDGTPENVQSRASFIVKDWAAVYPDTLVWIADFTYSYNEPMTNMYFRSPSYDHYPVVGITWKQANAFCNWRTNYLNWAMIRNGQPIVQNYRLPIEAEWEYAARGGLDHSMYPWGGVYLRNMSGCFIANFKPLRGNYTDDGSMYPTRVAHYNGNPNEYGLYDMAGNVSEWTITAYDPSAYVFSHDMNPYYNYQAKPDDPPVMKRKVVRGGSWKDIARYLQVSTRDYEYQDSAKSYIGFRCVRSYLGDS
jgi:formylglycine-generating enzyme required for sulfatase activity